MALPVTNMDNIRFAEGKFYNWLQTANYTGPVGLTAKMYVKADRVVEFLEIMEYNFSSTRGESGLRIYKLHADFKDPLAYWLVEEWESVSDVKSHCTSDKYVEGSKKMLGLLKDPICRIALY